MLFLWILRIQWSELTQRVVFFLLGPSSPPWLVGEWILSLTVYSLELLSPC